MSTFFHSILIASTEVSTLLLTSAYRRGVHVTLDDCEISYRPLFIRIIRTLRLLAKVYADFDKKTACAYRKCSN